MTVLTVILCPFLLQAYAEGNNCENGEHKYIETEKKAASKTEDGFIKYTCKICGRSYRDILFATGHVWGEWIIDREATCTESGSKHRHCSRGAGHDEQQNLPAVGHKYKVEITEPTAAKDGYKTYTCTVCGHSYTETFGKAIDNKPTHVHQYTEEITKKASCETEGIKTYNCTGCSDTYTEQIPATGHKWGEWITDSEAAEGIEGKKHKECKICGSFMEETVPALPANLDIKPRFTVADAAIGLLNVTLIAAFSVSVFSDVSLVRWDKRKKLETLARLVKEKKEADGFDFN